MEPADKYAKVTIINMFCMFKKVEEIMTIKKREVEGIKKDARENSEGEKKM